MILKFAVIKNAVLVFIQLPEHFQQVVELEHQNFAVNPVVARLARLKKVSRQPTLILFVVIEIETIIKVLAVVEPIAMTIPTLVTT
jgi:hypothetical protein